MHTPNIFSIYWYSGYILYNTYWSLYILHNVRKVGSSRRCLRFSNARNLIIYIYLVYLQTIYYNIYTKTISIVLYIKAMDINYIGRTVDRSGPGCPGKNVSCMSLCDAAAVCWKGPPKNKVSFSHSAAATTTEVRRVYILYI